MKLKALAAIVGSVGLMGSFAVSGVANAEVIGTYYKGNAGTQYAHTAYGYPYSSASDCYEGPGQNWTCARSVYKFYQGQCVDWVAHRLNTLSGVPMKNDVWYGKHWGNASNWDDVARQVGIPVNGTPARGAAAIWDSNGHNHVAFVERVNSDGSVLVSEMNTDLHNGFRMYRLTKTDRWPNKFIHFKDLPNTDGTQFHIGNVDGYLWKDMLPSIDQNAKTMNGLRVGTGWGGYGLVTQIGDINGDSRPDIIARQNSTGNLMLYTSNGNSWNNPKKIGTGWGAVRSIGDSGKINGKTRYITAVYDSNYKGMVRSFALQADGFHGYVAQFPNSSWLKNFSAGDLNGDGKSDVLAVAGGNLYFYPGSSTGKLGGGKIIGSVGTDQITSHEQGYVIQVTGDILYHRPVSSTSLGAKKATLWGVTGHTMI